MRSYIANGLDFSAAIGSATFTGLKLVGWDGGPASNVTLQKKPAARGAFRLPSKPTEDGKHLVFTGTVQSSSAADTLAAIDALNAAIAVDEFTFAVTDDGATRSMTVSRETEVGIVPSPTALVKQFNIQLAAADARKFGAALTGSTGLPSTSGGLTLPHTVPFSINATTVTGSVSLTNLGNTAGKILLRVDGQVTGPVISQSSSAGSKSLVFSTAYPIASGNWLAFDCDTPTITENGQASRRRYLTTSEWFQFDPGVNTFYLNAASSSGGALLTVTGYPAWD